MRSVVFLVNGAEHGAMAHRARAFAERLGGQFDITIGYRNGGRVAAIHEFSRMLRRTRPDLTYVFDLSYSGVLAAVLHRRTSGGRLIIDTGDAIHALARSIGRGRIGVALTGWLERFGLRNADRVVVRGTRHAEWMAERGIPSTVIPDGVETELFVARDSGALRSQLGLDGVMTVGLVGSSIWSPSLGLCYGWDLIELVHLLRDAAVKGVMIGDGSGIAHLRERCAELGLGNRVVFLGRVAYGDLPEYLSAIDVCLSTQTNDLPGQVRTTGKLPLYLAAGRYVLASRVGEAELVLPEEMLVDYHGVVDRAYPARLAERVHGLIVNPARLLEGRKGVATALERFDYDVLARRLGELMNDVLSAPVGAHTGSSS